MPRSLVLVLVLVFVAPVAALADLPDPGHWVNAYSLDLSSAINGVLVEIQPTRTHLLNSKFVWVRVRVNEKVVEGWLKKPAKPKRRRDCCGGNTTVVINNPAPRVAPVRQATAPVYFSQVNNTSTTVNQAPPPQPIVVQNDDNCRCRRPIAEYIYRDGRVIGNYCRTTREPVYWSSARISRYYRTRSIRYRY